MTSIALNEKHPGGFAVALAEAQALVAEDGWYLVRRADGKFVCPGGIRTSPRIARAGVFGAVTAREWVRSEGTALVPLTDLRAEILAAVVDMAKLSADTSGPNLAGMVRRLIGMLERGKAPGAEGEHHG
jgi:hypothetical protein